MKYQPYYLKAGRRMIKAGQYDYMGSAVRLCSKIAPKGRVSFRGDRCR